MKISGILSITFMVVGLVILIVLLTVGLVARQAIHDTILSRLETDLPGVPEQCYNDTFGQFNDEYYLWNLTNLDDVLAGGHPIYNLTGPYMYVSWYCYYDFAKDDSTGYLTYRQEQQGYRFIRDQSGSDEDVLITNVNPAYLGLLQAAGSEFQLTLVMSGAALETIITTFQAPSTVQALQLNAVATVLATINQQVYAQMALAGASHAAVSYLDALVASNVTVAAFFAPSFEVTLLGQVIKGFANYTLAQNGNASVDITPDSQNELFGNWTAAANGTALLAFASLDAATISGAYGVTDEQATSLLAYVANYLLSLDTYDPSVAAAVQAELYSQWANGTLGKSLTPGWEIGYPTPSDISVSDVQKLLDDSGSCALTNAAGVQLWIAALQTGLDIVGQCAYSLSAAQLALVENYFVTFATNVAGPALLNNAGVTNWDDFAYAQWGELAAGVSLGTAFAPEIAAYDISTAVQYNALLAAAPANCVKFRWDQAKELLNGTLPLFNTTNLVTFLTAANQGINGISELSTLWPINYANGIFQPFCFAAWIAYYLSVYAVRPQIQQFVDSGEALFITRTAHEWFFDANDALLEFLGEKPDVSLVGNTTVTREEADARNYTYVRVYTGHNDLHWSLMPSNEGEELPFWNGDVRITGYNGSQFLPFDALSDTDPGGYPLLLFNRLINRTIPFVNIGKDTWEGANVVYLTMAPDAILSETENPNNTLYYSVYSGLINKTSNPPYLPVYLSRADMIGVEDAVSANQTLIDDIFPEYDPTDEFSRHRLALFVLAEPQLGSSLWGNLPIQMNLKVTPTDIFYPQIQGHFAPIYWNAIGDKATSDDLDDIKNVLYAGQRAWKILVGVGVGAGVLFIIGGAIGFYRYKKYETMIALTQSSDSVTK